MAKCAGAGCDYLSTAGVKLFDTSTADKLRTIALSGIMFKQFHSNIRAVDNSYDFLVTIKKSATILKSSLINSYTLTNTDDFNINNYINFQYHNWFTGSDNPSYPTLLII
jgi:hypothetical protein